MQIIIIFGLQIKDYGLILLGITDVFSTFAAEKL